MVCSSSLIVSVCVFDVCYGWRSVVACWLSLKVAGQILRLLQFPFLLNGFFFFWINSFNCVTCLKWILYLILITFKIPLKMEVKFNIVNIIGLSKIIYFNILIIIINFIFGTSLIIFCSFITWCILDFINLFIFVICNYRRIWFIL